MGKYKNNNHEVDGITFDSRKEAARYKELKLRQDVGLITELQLQKKFQLIPTQRDPETGKAIRPMHYIADFAYREDGRLVVEDVKGYKGGKAYDVFKIKAKLMLYVHGIKVREV